MKRVEVQTPPALVTLRAYQSAPARVELVYRAAPGRLLRTVLTLAVFWGSIPFLLWVPPYYPWALGAFVAGLVLAYQEWHGRYRVYSFAGICPRCGHPLSLGVDRTISLPHTLTCYWCHFEPRLEVSFGTEPDGPKVEGGSPAHCTPECVGRWELRWLADEPFMVCDRCHAGTPATARTRRAAAAENERADVLSRLTREGRGIL
ncbi:MAG TPA: hypothetical protein VFL93_07880 [Longimicrobiaceae bacterium]|nr:hypothetical protein [Longimicrobiaceae bacterium]